MKRKGETVKERRRVPQSPSTTCPHGPWMGIPWPLMGALRPPDRHSIRLLSIQFLFSERHHHAPKELTNQGREKWALKYHRQGQRAESIKREPRSGTKMRSELVSTRILQMDERKKGHSLCRQEGHRLQPDSKPGLTLTSRGDQGHLPNLPVSS